MSTSSVFRHPRSALLSYAPLLLTRPLPRAGEGDPPPPNPADLAKKYDGDIVRMAGDMVESERKRIAAENKRDEHKRDLDEAKKQIPVEGSVVLSKEQAVEWDAYQKLGSAKDVGAAITERDELKGKLTTSEAKSAKLERDNTLRDVAAAAGYHFDVLSDRDTLTPGLTYEVRDVEEGGKKVPTAFVKYRNGEGDNAPIEEKTLAEYAQEKWSRYLPSLQIATDEDAGAQHIEQGSGGTKHVEQGSSGKGGKKDIFAGIREKNAQAAKVVKEHQGETLEQIMNLGTNPGAAL